MIVRNLRTLALAFGLASMVLAGCAAAHRSTNSTDESSLDVDNSSDIVSDVQEFNVDGIHVLMRRSTAAPVVSAILFINGGSSVTPPNEPISTEYFAMSVAPASGSEHYSKAYFRRRMVSMGTTITGDDGRDYSLLALRCTRENFDTSWAYFADMITHPAFDPVEYENFKQSVLIGINSRNTDADVYSSVVADSVYFQGHPYGRMLSVADVQAQSLPNVAAHYRKMMEKSRLLLSVVGNISRKELTEKIHNSLASLREGSFTTPHLNPPPKAFTPGLVMPKFDRPLPTDYIVGYYLVPSMGDPDYYPYLRLRNFFGGFVFNHIRVERNLAYAPNVDDKEGRTSIGEITVQTPYVDSAIQVIYNDVDFFQRNQIRESAIREGVAGWATRNYLKAETTQSQALLLGQAELMTGDWHNAFFSYEKLADVTPEELQQAALKYLRNFNWVVVGDTTHVSRALLQSR